MLNIGTSTLENSFYRLTNFKALLRRSNFSVNIYSQTIFREKHEHFRHISEQIKRSTKRLINYLKINKIKPKTKVFSILKYREHLQKFYPFGRVYILKKYFKLARFET